MNTFKFWSVGQGLFYTGSILNGNFNFVYDCGSNDIKYINTQVDEYLGTFNPAKTIDFVIISHLHYDHFSGLYQLAKNAKIKKLYLPYLGDNDEIKTLILANAVFGENNIESNDNLRQVFNFMLYLYRVESDRIVDEFLNIEIEPFFINDNIISRDNGSSYSLNRPIEINEYWKFSLIAKQISDIKYADLSKRISDLLKEENVEHVLDLVNKPKGINNICEKIYNPVFKKNQNPASGDYRVLRGGNWSSSADYCRCAYRNYNFPSYRDFNLGFRVVRSAK